MKQRIIAILLALTLLVTVGVVAVSAEGTATCPHCNKQLAAADWTDWTGTKITESGHYKLSASNEALTGQLAIGAADANIDVVIDLNGYVLSSTSRIFAVYPTCSLFLMDSVGTGEIKGKINGTSQHGCVVRVDSGATFTLHSGTVTDNLADGTTRTASYGGAIDVNGGTAYIKGGTVNGKSAKYGAAISVRGGGSLTMTAGTINGGTAGTDGGSIYNTGTVTISGGTITGGTAGQHGGNIYNTGKLTISGTAVIEDGTCTYASDNNNYGGGNIYTNGSSALLTIEGGTIQNGAAGKNEGGNIYVRSDMVMTDGAIIGGTATGDGSSIAIREYDVTISGGSITDGNVSVIRDGWTSFTVSGDPYIENIQLNTHDGAAANKITLTVGAAGLAEGASIGVETAADQAIFDAGTNASAAQYLTSTATRASAEVDADGNITLVENTWCEACGADATWTAWTGGGIADVTDGSHYYLTKNITSGGRVLLGTTDVVQTMCIDLNGYSIHKGLNVRNIYLRPGTTAHLMNSSSRESELSSQMTNGAGGVLYFEKNDTNSSVVHLYDGLKLYNAYEGNLTVSGSVVYLSNDCELHMHGGTIIGHDNSQSDGGVFVGGTFNMSGGKITGANAAIGGAIRVGSPNAELNISGSAVIDGGVLTDERNGGAIYVTSGNVNITGGTINGSTVSGNGGAIYAEGENTSVSISGGTVNGGEAELGGGGAITVCSGASLEVSGTALINGGTGKLGGAVYVLDADSSFTMTGGTIQNGKTQIGATSYYGGNLYLGSGATANITGGTIKDGTAYADGGNIFQHQSAGKLTISGNAVISGGMITYYKVTNGELTTTLQDKTNTNYGGGNIYVRGTTTIGGNAQIIGAEDPVTNCGANIYVRGTLNIEGGTITGGDATYQADCIAVRNNNEVNVSGGKIDGIAVIRSDANNGSTITVSGAPTIGYIDVASYTTDTAYDITLGALSEGASIGIIAEENEPFTVADADLAEASKGYFFDANELLTVEAVDGCLVLIKGPVKCPHCDQMLYDADWKAWDGGAILTAGHYYVPDTGISTSGQKQVGDSTVADNSAVDVCLDLRGNTAKNTGSRMFVIRTKAKLFVMDSVGGGEITGVIHASNQKGCVIRVTDGAVFTLHSGTIRDAYTGIRAGRGGAIGAEGEGATININGGTVTGKSASYGAAIDVETGAILNITAGTINGGTATSFGGAVCLMSSTMNMSGGTINGGTALYGGAVYANAGSTVTISDDAVITDGKAIDDDSIPYGGNIYCAGVFTMTGGTVSNGQATSANKIARGGNIYVQGTADVHTISSGTISGGISSGNGGNIYVGSGTMNISGGIITNGVANRAIAHTNGGGNVYGLEASVINITGGTITDGTTASLGGNVYTRGTASISNEAAISGGSSEYAFGGEVAVSGGALTIEGLGDAWSGRITMTNDGVITNDYVGVAATLYREGRAFDIWYSSVDAVKATDTEDDNTYLALTLDGTYDLSGHVVDIRGYNVTVNDAAACFDSSNDDYEGYGIATLNKAPQTSYIAPSGNLYITVAEGNGKYSFHRLNMTMEYANVRSSVGGVYYTAKWNADNVLAGDLKADTYNPIVYGYGIALTKGDVALENFETQGAFTYFDNMEGFTNNFLYNARGKEINSCVLKNIVKTTNSAAQNLENAQTVINAAPFVYFKAYTGEIVPLIGDASSYSYMQLIEGAAAIPEMAEKVQSLCENWFLGTENYKIGPDVDAAKYPNLYALLNPAEA